MIARASVIGCLLASTALLYSCSNATEQDPPANDTDASIDPKPDATPTSDAPLTPDAPETHYRFLCDAPKPAGSPSPQMPAMPAAGCPVLVPGSNTITSSANARQFILVIPNHLLPTEHPPVLFLWHWLGGSPEGFVERGQIQQAADDQRFIGVVPVSKGANIFGTSWNLKWPFDITQSPARMNEEFTFFDDMLACVRNQYPINDSCVSTVGVSAGALFTDQLAQARSQTLASFISLSGGTGNTIIKPWAGAARKLPGVVLWGGDGPPMMDGNTDLLGCAGIGMNFSIASREMETALHNDGHFIVECRHNCGHVEPPLVPYMNESQYAGMWQFALNHPFWLPAGQSPFLTDGLPPSMPAWCSIGMGTSTPRSGGGCPMAENPCPN
jgi:hypothetical protein